MLYTPDNPWRDSESGDFFTACVRVYQHCRDCSTTIQRLLRETPTDEGASLEEIAQKVRFSVIPQEQHPKLRMGIAIEIGEDSISTIYPDGECIQSQDTLMRMAPAIVYRVFQLLKQHERESIANHVLPAFHEAMTCQLEDEHRYDEQEVLTRQFYDLREQLSREPYAKLVSPGTHDPVR